MANKVYYMSKKQSLRARENFDYIYLCSTYTVRQRQAMCKLLAQHNIPFYIVIDKENQEKLQDGDELQYFVPENQHLPAIALLETTNLNQVTITYVDEILDSETFDYIEYEKNIEKGIPNPTVEEVDLKNTPETILKNKRKNVYNFYTENEDNYYKKSSDGFVYGILTALVTMAVVITFFWIQQFF